MSAAVAVGGDEDEGAVREGFLCPICLQDLHSVYQLQAHFEENHNSEDKAVLHQLKGLFGKAKRFLGKNEQQSSVEEAEAEAGETGAAVTGPQTTSWLVGGVDDTQWPPQELGAVCNHYEYFRAQRGSRLDRGTVETNKLLIRLEKLARFSAGAADPSKRKGKRARKAFEKTVVPWKDDSSMRYCPFCMEKFGLSMRRHHCRLCGNIACQKCSTFLPNTVCESLLMSEEELLRHHRREQERRAKGGGRGGEGEEDEDLAGTLRACQNCDRLLAARLQAVRQKVIKPTVVLLYEKLAGVKKHVTAQLSVHNPKVESLLSGTSSQSRDKLEKERGQILKNFDLIDVISKKILGLGASAASPAQQRLFQKIRMHCTLFLQAHMHNMVALPTAEELEALQARRRAAIARRIQEEKAAELQAQQRQERQQQQQQQQQSKTTPEHVAAVAKRGHVRIPSWPLNLGRSRPESSPASGAAAGKPGGGAGARTTEAGWKPAALSQARLMAASDDPMVQQMDIIRHYIRQARDMRRPDEVRMLEENLRDLELEYERQGRT